MPASSRRSGAFSPPLSSTTSYANGTQPKLINVSKLAIEGKAKQGADGASIRLFLKISVPTESISPGMILPIFSEENVKIHHSQVHPIDSNSVPYNFSSKISPLLHKAARALNLPSRSTKSYLSLFGPSGRDSQISTLSRVATSNENGSASSPLDEKYTGYILVSGYNVCYVLPKEFPPNCKIGSALSDSEGEALSSRSVSRTPFKNRRSSISEKSSMQFMAALDLWVPYSSKPPKAPYLLSIPIPRCLSNTIKVRIFPPKNTAASFASLSSEEEAGSWDLTTDPHVTRTNSRHAARSNMYNHFADNESSDSSVTGFSDGCGIQGTFPSSECVRVRWASQSKTQDSPNHGDGRRRVGVSDVKGDMTCTVLGRDADGVKMRIDYQGTCKGIWYPGVATMLGMDVSIDVQGCRILWSEDHDNQWHIEGGTGFTGFDVGPPLRSPSRPPSMEFPQLMVQTASPGPNRSSAVDRHYPMTSRSSSTSSASLLRAPLPQHRPDEYSFENSTPGSSIAPSTITALTPSSSILEQSDEDERNLRPPSVPITIHVNMNDLLPPSKNIFTFNITGTVLIFPLPLSSNSVSQSNYQPDSWVIPLPMFNVLTAETEVVSMNVRSRSEDTIVEVLSPSSDTLNPTRRTTLNNGSQIKCSVGTKINLKPILAETRVKLEKEAPSLSLGRPHTTNRMMKTPSIASLHREKVSGSKVPFREGPLVIPWLIATVLPLITSDPNQSPSYAVMMLLPMPVDGPSEWLEFGLAMPPRSPSGSASISLYSHPPEVDIVSASVFGVPVRFETFGQLQRESSGLTASELAETDKKKWLTWVRVHCGGGGELELVYIVRDGKQEPREGTTKGKDRARGQLAINLFLPMFSLPIGRMEVIFEKLSNSDVIFQSNVPHQQDLAHSRKFFAFDLNAFFYWDLVVTLRHPVVEGRGTFIRKMAVRTGKVAAKTAPMIVALLLFGHVVRLGGEVRQMRQSLESCSTILDATVVETEPSAPTTTIFQTTVVSADRWWYVETPAASDTWTATSPIIPSSTSTQTSYTQEEHIFSTATSFEPTNTPAEAVAYVLPLYAPFPWPKELRLDFEKVTDKILTGLERAWGVLQMVFHWPLPPE